jgi:D-alanine-D-alanine ligase
VSRRLRVAVLMGGRSSEHAISVASGRSVLAALDPSRYEASTIEIGRDGTWELGAAPQWALVGAGEPPGSPETPSPGPLARTGGYAAGSEPQSPSAATLPVPGDPTSAAASLADVDVVLPILHGPFGEDGTVQGLLELANVPYVGAGVAASAVNMDKDLAKAVLRARGIPVTRSVTIREGDPLDHPFDYPVFIKPARLGSSVGITKVRSPEQLEPAVAVARQHDEKVLIEELVDGKEVECGVLGNRQPIASLPGEIVAHGFAGEDWYDFSAKYDEGGMDLIVPPKIDQATIARVQEISVDAFVATECEGMARVDCFVTRDGDVLVNELNTIPGFTPTSVYAKLFEESGIPYPELLDRLIELAVERHERRSRLKY